MFFLVKKIFLNSFNTLISYTVRTFISSDWRCQNVLLSITNMFVIDNKENISLINHIIVCD